MSSDSFPPSSVTVTCPLSINVLIVTLISRWSGEYELKLSEFAGGRVAALRARGEDISGVDNQLPNTYQAGRRRSGTKVQRQRCKGKQWVIDVARLLPAPNDPLSLPPRSRTPHLLEHQATTIAR